MKQNTSDNKRSPKTIQGLNYRDWQILLQLIHKAQTNRDDTKRGRKRGGLQGQMDKIIRQSVIWEKLDVLEDKVREVCFKFD